MKQKWIKIVGCMITICLTFFIMAKLTDLMERKSSDEKYADFWKQEADFDVLFMGTSHVINGVYPMELWNDYGIVSYNCGGHSNEMATTYWVMENVLDQTKPKVVVIDCLAISGNRKCSDIFSYLHLSLDTFPFSLTKVKAIWDLLDDPVLEMDIANGTARQSDEPRTKIGLLWNYSVYHSRWNEIRKTDFEIKDTYEKGAESRIAVTRGELNRISKGIKIDGGTTGEKYLRMMIEECQKNGIEVLLTYLPFPASEWKQKEANYIYDIANEYNVKYINFLDMDIVNYQIDMYDKNSHLNPSGARKVTEYLGEYLVKNYGVMNQRDNGVYQEWHADYEEYNIMKNNNLVKEKSIVNYLMLLAEDEVDISIDIRNKDIFENAWIMELMENIGINTKLVSNNTDFIIVKNHGENVEVINDFRENGLSKITTLGTCKIMYDADEKSNYSLYLDGVEQITGNMNDNTSMQINVFRDNSMVDSVKFVYVVDPQTNTVNTIAVNR